MFRPVLWMTFVLHFGATGAFAQQDPDTTGLTVNFASGAASIARAEYPVLDQAARLFREGGPLVMIVTGSADTVGSAESNLDLSIRRAQAVANSLADRGIPVERLQVLGRGNSELPVATGDGVPNAANRAVSIIWR